MRGPRRIPAHAVDGAPNLGRQTIDTFRIPRIVVPYLTAASECTWLIGKQEQQCSGHDWRKPVCVTHPHAHTRSGAKDLANAVAKQRLSGMPTVASGNVVRTNLIDFLGFDVSSGVIRDWGETTADQAISGIPRLLPVVAMQPRSVMCQLRTRRSIDSRPKTKPK